METRIMKHIAAAVLFVACLGLTEQRIAATNNGCQIAADCYCDYNNFVGPSVEGCHGIPEETEACWEMTIFCDDWCIDNFSMNGGAIYCGPYQYDPDLYRGSCECWGLYECPWGNGQGKCGVW